MAWGTLAGMEDALKRLSPDQAQEILLEHARRSLGAAVSVTRPTFHAEDGVWEAWVHGTEHHVKAYILRPLPGGQGWACRHVQVERQQGGLGDEF